MEQSLFLGIVCAHRAKLKTGRPERSHLLPAPGGHTFRFAPRPAMGLESGRFRQAGIHLPNSAAGRAEAQVVVPVLRHVPVTVR